MYDRNSPGESVNTDSLLTGMYQSSSGATKNPVRRHKAAIPVREFG